MVKKKESEVDNELSFSLVFSSFCKIAPKLCVLTLLTAAFARLDLIGIVWISIFGFIVVLTPRDGTTIFARIAWIAALAFSCGYLLSQAVFQILHQIFIAPGTVAVAASLQLHAAAQYRRRKAWGSLLELEDAETGFYRYLSFFLALVVGCFYPGFSNLPYAIASLTLFWTWSQGGPPGGTTVLGVVQISRILKGCQMYVAAHGLMLYLWQLNVIQHNKVSMLDKAMRMLGIYQFQSPNGSDDKVLLGTQAVHTAFLATLFVCLGYACEFDPRQVPESPRTPINRAKASIFSDRDEFEQRRRRVLQQIDRRETQQAAGTLPVPTHHRRTLTWQSWIFGLGPTAVEATVRRILVTALRVAGDLSWEAVCRQYIGLWEWATGRTSVVGFFVALMTVLAPSWPGLGVFAVGLALLIVPEQYSTVALRPLATPLVVAAALWALAAQVATSLSQVPGIVDISNNAQSLGLYSFPLAPVPFFVPFGAMMLAVAALAGFRRRLKVAAREAANRRPAPQGFFTTSQVMSALQQPVSSTEDHPYRTAALVAKEALKHVTLVAIHYTLRLLFPAATFLVGVSRNDLLHVAYVAAVLVGISRNVLLLKRFKEGTNNGGVSAVLGYSSDIVKYYALAHCAAQYVFGLRIFPGYGWGEVYPGSKMPRDGPTALKVLGLARVEYEAELLPVLCLLAFATWFTSLDTVLKSRRRRFFTMMQELLAATDSTANLRPVLEHVQKRARDLRNASLNFAMVANTYLLILLGYIVVIHGVRPGTCLGLGYLGFLLAILTLPPNHPAHSSKLKRLRWVFLWLLALYAICDFALQYIITFRLFRNRVDMSSSTLTFFKDTVGIDPSISGLKLVAALVRSGVILGLLNGHRVLSIAYEKRSAQRARTAMLATLSTATHAQQRQARAQRNALFREANAQTRDSSSVAQQQRRPRPSTQIGRLNPEPLSEGLTTSGHVAPHTEGLAVASSRDQEIVAESRRGKDPLAPRRSNTTARRAGAAGEEEATAPLMQAGDNAEELSPRSVVLEVYDGAVRSFPVEADRRTPTPPPSPGGPSAPPGGHSRSGPWLAFQSTAILEDEEEKDKPWRADSAAAGSRRPSHSVAGAALPPRPSAAPSRRSTAGQSISSMNVRRPQLQGRSIWEAMGASIDFEADEEGIYSSEGIVGFVQRLAILLADHAVILALFFDATRLQSMLHLIFVGIVITITIIRPRAYGGGLFDGTGFPNANTPAPVARLWFLSTASFLGALYFYAACTLLLQYLVQLDTLSELTTNHRVAVQWGLGLVRMCTADSGVNSECAERAMRSKVLLVLATRLALHARVWRGHLPEDVKKAAPFGRPCPLFFPRPELPWDSIVNVTRRVERAEERRGEGRAASTATGTPAMTPAGLAMRDPRAAPWPLRLNSNGYAEGPPQTTPLGTNGSLAYAGPGLNAAGPSAGPDHRLASHTSLAVGLRATGLGDPAPGAASRGASVMGKEKEEEEDKGNETGSNRTDTGSDLSDVDDLESEASLEDLPLDEVAKSHFLARYTEILSRSTGLMNFLENPWSVLGLEVTSLMYLLAIYSSLSVISLILIVALLVLTVARTRHRMIIWRWIVQPLLGLIVIYQYFSYLGLPEEPDTPGAQHKSRFRTKITGSKLQTVLSKWLASDGATYATLWYLFLSFGCVSIQLVYDKSRVRDMELEGQDSPEHQAPKDLVPPEAIRDRGVLPPWATATLSHLCTDGFGFVWARLEAQAIPFWTWSDHLRFLILKHASSAVLILVFILSLVNTDILHAIYLVWALVLFRLRSSLLERGSLVFRWLAVYNLCVILAVIIYQAPWSGNASPYPPPPLSSPPPPPYASGPSSDDKCTALHVIGLFHLRNTSQEQKARLIAPDIVLFLVLRLTIFLTGSRAYLEVADLATYLNRLTIERRLRHDEQKASAEAETAWGTWEYRRRREARVARLNAGVNMDKGGAFGIDPALLDFDELGIGFTADGKPEPLLLPPETDDMMGLGLQSLGANASQAPPPSRTIEPRREGANESEELLQTMDGTKQTWIMRLRTRAARFVSSGNYNESHACLVTYVVLHTVDWSILSVVFTVGIFAYSFVSQRSARTFWALVLLYAELLLMANYAVSIPFRFSCSTVESDPVLRDRLAYAGLHISPRGMAPLYLAYLATLGHNYSLVQLQAARAEWQRRNERRLRSLADASNKANGSLEPAPLLALANVGMVGKGLRRLFTKKHGRAGPGPGPSNPDVPTEPKITLGERLRIGCIKTGRFLRGVLQGAERGPHFLAVTFRCPQDALGPPGSRAPVLEFLLNNVMKKEYRREQDEYEAERMEAIGAASQTQARGAAPKAHPTRREQDLGGGGEPNVGQSRRQSARPGRSRNGPANAAGGERDRDAEDEAQRRPSGRDPPRPSSGGSTPEQESVARGILKDIMSVLGPDFMMDRKYPLFGYGRPLLRTREVRTVDLGAFGLRGLELLGEDPALWGLQGFNPFPTPFNTVFQTRQAGSSDDGKYPMVGIDDPLGILGPYMAPTPPESVSGTASSHQDEGSFPPRQRRGPALSGVTEGEDEGRMSPSPSPPLVASAGLDSRGGYGGTRSPSPRGRDAPMQGGAGPGPSFSRTTFSTSSANRTYVRSPQPVGLEEPSMPELGPLTIFVALIEVIPLESSKGSGVDTEGYLPRLLRPAEAARDALSMAVAKEKKERQKPLTPPRSAVESAAESREPSVHSAMEDESAYETPLDSLTNPNGNASGEGHGARSPEHHGHRRIRHLPPPPIPGRTEASASAPVPRAVVSSGAGGAWDPYTPVHGRPPTSGSGAAGSRTGADRPGHRRNHSALPSLSAPVSPAMGPLPAPALGPQARADMSGSGNSSGRGQLPSQSGESSGSGSRITFQQAAQASRTKPPLGIIIPGGDDRPSSGAPATNDSEMSDAPFHPGRPRHPGGARGMESTRTVITHSSVSMMRRQPQQKSFANALAALFSEGGVLQGTRRDTGIRRRLSDGDAGSKPGSAPGSPTGGYRGAAGPQPELLQSGTGLPSWLRVLRIEYSARRELDLYTAQFICDGLAFLYVAFFYRNVFVSSNSLKDSFGENIVPADYLGTIFFLFITVILERVAYSLGSQKYKAILHYFEVSFYFGYLTNLYWFSPLMPAAAAHLRVFLLLKMAKFLLAARQIRSGFPSPMSYRDGAGRSSLFWASKVRFINWFIGFLYMVVPFLWEIRIVLDWLCAKTTLMLFDWFKLEEINRTLYNTTFNRLVRSRRKLGEREPTWRKLVHGLLFLIGLILVLWVPLLIFANSGLSLRDPEVSSAAVNATILIHWRASNGTSMESVSLPIYSGGLVLSAAAWGLGTGPSSRPVIPSGLPYSKKQARLICSSQYPEKLEPVGPVARDTALELLSRSQLHGGRLTAVLRTTWEVDRSIPASAPRCFGTHEAPLSTDTLGGLTQVLSAPPLDPWPANQYPSELNLTTGDGTQGTFPLFWRLRGSKQCSVDVGYKTTFGQEGRIARSKPQRDLSNYQVFCRLRLNDNTGGDATPTLVGQPLSRGLQCYWGERGSAAGPAPSPPQGSVVCPSGLAGPQQVVLLDRVHAGILGERLGSLSISGLYIGFVFAIGRILRTGFSNIRTRIPYDELPSTARLLQLVRDLYTARAEGDLTLEEKLYWSLINIYRDPALLIRFGRKDKQD